jgi:hypothetical protein
MKMPVAPAQPRISPLSCAALSISLSEHCVQLGRRLAADIAAFEMHLVIIGIIGLHRQKGAGADMQRHEMSLDASLVERIEEVWREMQPGCRRRDSAVLAGVDGLVIGPVARVLGALGGDIGWQRNMADGMDDLVKRMHRQI